MKDSNTRNSLNASLNDSADLLDTVDSTDIKLPVIFLNGDSQSPFLNPDVSSPRPASMPPAPENISDCPNLLSDLSAKIQIEVIENDSFRSPLAHLNQLQNKDPESNWEEEVNTSELKNEEWVTFEISISQPEDDITAEVLEKYTRNEDQNDLLVKYPHSIQIEKTEASSKTSEIISCEYPR